MPLMSSSRQGNDEPDGQLESGDVPPTRAEFRCDDALKAAAEAEARSAGESFSEFVRGCIRMRLVQIATVRAIQAGTDPESILDPKRYAELLAEMARQRKGP